MAGNLLIPTMRYTDAPKMMAWLSNVMGFAPLLVVEDDAGGIRHAQLSRGEQMIMIGSVRDDEFGAVQRPPAIGGPVNQSVYLVVGANEDVDEIAGKAADNDGEVVIAVQNEAHGGRSVTVRDPGGQIWTVGSYNPWKD